MELGDKVWEGATPHPAAQFSSHDTFPIAGPEPGRFLTGSQGVTPQFEEKLETWGLLGSLYFSFSYLLHLSQKLRIHCSVCRNQCPAATATQTLGYFDLLACRMMLYCYWYRQTCNLKRKTVFASIFSPWKSVLILAMRTVQSLNKDASEEWDHPIRILNNCSFWKQTVWFGKEYCKYKCLFSLHS